jgi:hypothetical protein
MFATNQKSLVYVGRLYHVFTTIQLQKIANHSHMEDVAVMEITSQQKVYVKRLAKLNLNKLKKTACALFVIFLLFTIDFYSNSLFLK